MAMKRIEIHHSPRVRDAFAKAATWDGWYRAARDDPSFLVVLAGRAGVPIGYQEVFFRHSDPRVRAALAANPDCWTGYVRILADDPNSEVRLAAWARLDP